MKEYLINGIIGLDQDEKWMFDLLQNAGGEDLRFVISSPGGFVYRGLAMYNMMRNYKGNLDTHLVSLGASMASVLALAGKRRTAESTAVFMIHNPMSFMEGNYLDAEKFLNYMNGVTKLMRRVYSESTGKTEKEIKELMDAETYFFGEEIKESGFVHEIKTAEKSESRDDAIAYARIAVEDCIAKLKSAKLSDDPGQVAALLTEIPLAIAHNPAPNAGKNTMEVQKMTLNEFLSQNPAAKNEYDAELSAKFNAGKIEGENAVKARIAKAAPFLMSDCKYPNQIKDLAVGVIKGEKSTEGLETAVAVYDALAEKGNSAAAADESAATAVATGQQPPAEPSKDGVIRGEADMEAAIVAAKKSLGMEVK